MLKSKKIVALVLLTILAVPLLSSSSIIYAQSQGWIDKRTENLIELADQAQEKVETLFNLIYADETTIEKISVAELLDDLEGNHTLFEQATALLAEAQAALDEGPLQEAAEKAVDALRTFRDVFKALNRILADAEVQGGRTLVDARGLIEAMERALDRIERLRAVMPENATDALAMLDEAESYLNVDEAIALLNEGNVGQVASRLAEANRLIAQVCGALKVQARLMNAVRIQNFLRGLQNAQVRIQERLETASREGFNVTAILRPLGYTNMEQFNQSMNNMIQNATQRVLEIKNAVHELNIISSRLRDINREMLRHGVNIEGNGGQGNNGNNNGNGDGQGNGNGLGGP